MRKGDWNPNLRSFHKKTEVAVPESLHSSYPEYVHPKDSLKILIHCMLSHTFRKNEEKINLNRVFFPGYWFNELLFTVGFSHYKVRLTILRDWIKLISWNAHWKTWKEMHSRWYNTGKSIITSPSC